LIFLNDDLVLQKYDFVYIKMQKIIYSQDSQYSGVGLVVECSPPVRKVAGSVVKSLSLSTG